MWWLVDNPGILAQYVRTGQQYLPNLKSHYSPQLLWGGGGSQDCYFSKLSFRVRSCFLRNDTRGSRPTWQLGRQGHETDMQRSRDSWRGWALACDSRARNSHCLSAPSERWNKTCDALAAGSWNKISGALAAGPWNEISEGLPEGSKNNRSMFFRKSHPAVLLEIEWQGWYLCL